VWGGEIPRPAGENAGLRDDAGKEGVPDSANCTTICFYLRSGLGGISAGKIVENCHRLPLLQPCVLGIGLLQDREVGVGVFPESEEIFVGGESADAGGVGIGSLVRLRL
jgi:hypothetical protein